MNPEKIIVRGTNWIGDAVMTLPALAALRSIFPDARIDVMARRWSAPIYSFSPHADDVIEHDKPMGFAPFGKLVEAASKIRERDYDLAIAFPNSFESALIFRLAGIPRICGYNTDFRSVILTDAVDVPHDKSERHEVFYYLGLVERLFCNTKRHWREELHLRLEIPKEAREEAAGLLRSLGSPLTRPLIGINPGAAFGPAKCWPAERYAELSARLAEAFPDASILVFGTDEEWAIGELVVSGISERALNLCGRTTLDQAIAVIDELDLMVTNDSGLMHVAAACRVPVVAIFGSTNPVATGPWSDKARIIRHPLPCSPCMNRECPRDFICMAGIGVDEVLQACMKSLK